jgi:hypothetical protein
MNLKINQKDKKTLQIGGIGVIVVIVLVFGLKGFDIWKQAKNELATLEGRIETLNTSKDPQLHKKVPDFNMPVGKEEQQYRFRDSIEAKIQAVGINSGPLGEQSGGKTPVPGYDLIRYKSSGNCTFSQLLNLLAYLKEDPYLVGIEELRIKVTTPQQQRTVTSRSTTGTAGRSNGTSSSASTLTPNSMLTSPQTQMFSMQPGGQGGQQSGRQTSYELTVSTLAKTK